MAFQQDKHDIGILRQDGSTKVGFILARKNGTPIYEVYDDEYLARHQTTVAGYDALSPEKEFAIVRDDWRSGFGLEVYDENDPKRYFASYGMDLRFRGMALAGPKATGIAVPATASTPTYTITDASIESWTGNTPDSWSLSAGASSYVKDEQVIVHDGTHSCQFDLPGNATKYYIYQDFTNPGEWDYYDITITAYGRQSNPACTARLELMRNGSSVAADDVSTTDSFEQLSVSYTVPTGTTSLQIRLNATDDNTNEEVYWDLVALSFTAPIAKTNPHAFAEFNDGLYLDFGKFVYKLNGTGDGWTAVGPADTVYGFDATITDLEPFNDDQLYIALGTSNAYWEITTGEVFTENTLTVTDFKFFTMVGPTPTMWGVDSDNTIRSTVNPANGGTQWSATTTVDTSYHDINSMLSFDNALYIFKDDRPYYLDSNGAVQTLTNITRPITTANGGKNSIEYQGKIYMPWGKTILEWDSGTFTWRSPAEFGNAVADFDGDVQALAADEQWLFAAVDNGAKIEILAGRLETIGSTTSWVWHPIQEITLAGCETMFVSNVYQKRLWIASTSSSDSLYYIPLPSGYGDVVNDTNRSFQTGGYFITPWHHANFKGDSKAFIKITLTMTGTSSTVYFTVEYQLKGSSNWTEINSTAKFKTSPTTTGYIPVDDISSAKPVSTAIRFKITAVTGATTSTPVLIDYDVRGILYPTRRDLIYCEVRCADQITLNDGTKERDNDAANIKTVLEEAKNNATWPVTLYDYKDGSTIYVRILPTKPFSKIVKDEVSGNLERRFYLLLQKVPLS